MVYKRKGFTLIELLIAAVIIGVLAVFATQTFRQSASDIRIQDAKNRAKVIAMAAHRMRYDYPDALFTEEVLSDTNLQPRSTIIEEGNACSFPRPEPVDLQTMVDCGYLEYRKYLDANFQFKFFDGVTSSGERYVEVCVKANPEGSKALAGLDDEFCTNGLTTTEATGAFE